MNDLTITEQASLEGYERVIEKGLASFYEVGSALLTIRDSKLYRGTHGTFEAYCLDKWGMSKPRAYQLIDAAKVKDNLSTIVDLPATESQTRPLSSLPPDQQAPAWQKAVETAPPGGVTAKHVQEVVDSINKPDKKTMALWREKKAKQAMRAERAERLHEIKQFRYWWRVASDENKLVMASWIRKEEMQLPTDAESYAVVAIRQLERISDDDPIKDKALDMIEAWIKQHRNGWNGAEDLDPALNSYSRAMHFANRATTQLAMIQDDDDQREKWIEKVIEFCNHLKKR